MDNNPKWRGCSNEYCDNRFESIHPQSFTMYCEDCEVYYDLDQRDADIKHLKDKIKELELNIKDFELDIKGLKSFIRYSPCDVKKLDKLQSSISIALEAFKVIKSKYCLNESEVAEQAIVDIERNT